MIVSQETTNSNIFKKKFEKKFKNFCSKLPILLSYNLQPNGVVLYEHMDEKDTDNKQKLFYFAYDYEIPVEKNIFKIKSMLKKYFPVMKETKSVEVEADTEELNKKVSEGELTFNDLSPKGYIIKQENEWRIEKVIMERDEIFVRDTHTNTLYRYHLRYPVVTFLKKMRRGDMGPTEAWNFFQSKATRKPLDTLDEGEEEYNNAQS
jgi:hypothetical protein